MTPGRLPELGLLKHGQRGDLKHLLPTPKHDARLDVKTVAQRRPRRSRIGEPQDDIHPLLLDAERGEASSHGSTTDGNPCARPFLDLGGVASGT